MKASRLTTRRGLLAGTLIAGTARSAARIIGANDRIGVGIIGLGGKGANHVRQLIEQSDTVKDIRLAAACDVYQRALARAGTLGRIPRKDWHLDYRELLDRKDVDAVFIVTPDHWHERMTLDAFAAGKDVYLQKPVTLTIAESERVMAAAAKHSRVLQVGSQFLSDPRWHRVRDLIGEGAIGTLLWAQSTYSRNSLHGEWNYHIDEEATPQTIDWKRWLGPAAACPFSAEKFFRWRKYWEYSNGIASDLFYHRLGPLLVAMNAGMPVQVSGVGGIHVQKDREVPDTYITTIEYPEFSIVLAASMANSAANRFLPETIYGHRGTIVVEADRVMLCRETLKPGESPGAARAFPFQVPELNRLHTDNFFACMRSRAVPNLGPQLAHRIMTAIGMGIESYRSRKMQVLAARPPRRARYAGDGRNLPGGLPRLPV